MKNNICHYISYERNEETVHTLYFVCERDFGLLPQNQTLAFYKVYIVVSGSGTLKTFENCFPLRSGDVFFVFPGVPHSILTDKEAEPLQCMYISFFGIRANQIMERYHITSAAPVYSGHTELIAFWERSMALVRKNNADILSESVLLYTLSVLGIGTDGEKGTKNSNLLHKIKEYIDENYSNQTLTLNSVCGLYHYNPKYISTMFKKYYRTGFNEYLVSVRVRQACALIHEGVSYIKDIAARCGFRDQYYFSRVFKEHTGMPPRLYITEYKKNKK